MGDLSSAIPASNVVQTITLVNLPEFLLASLGLGIIVIAAVFWKRAKKQKLKKIKEHQARIDAEKQKDLK